MLGNKKKDHEQNQKFQTMNKRDTCFKKGYLHHIRSNQKSMNSKMLSTSEKARYSLFDTINSLVNSKSMIPQHFSMNNSEIDENDPCYQVILYSLIIGIDEFNSTNEEHFAKKHDY
jgi:hypothetical protein